MMRWIPLIAAVLAAVIFFSARPLYGGIGVHTGYNSDVEQSIVGINGWMSLGGSVLSLILNPELHFHPAADPDYTELDANILLGFGDPTGTIVPFVGGGVGFLYTSAAPPGYGVNVTGGLLMNILILQPFAQGTITVGDNTRFRALAGVALSL